ncbi:MAG: hypothetical protein RR549_01150 [Oscillospiraceae bacterium]
MENIFKTKAFGGFNKKQVLECINEYYEKNAYLENMVKKLKEEKENNKAELMVEISQYKDKEEKYISVLEQSEQFCKNQKDQIVQLRTQVEKLKEENNLLNGKILNINGENIALKKSLDDANTVLFQKIEELNGANEKAAEFDKFKLKQKEVQEKINEFLEKAKEKADIIITDAKIEAETIKQNTQKEILEINENAKDISIAMDKLKQDVSTVLNFVTIKSNNFENVISKNKENEY